MKTFLATVALCSCIATGASAKELFRVGMDWDFKFRNRHQASMACFVAISSSGAAPATSPKDAIDWCIAAAGHLYDHLNAVARAEAATTK